MNTVMTLTRDFGSINFTHRNDEFRVVIKDTRETDNILLARVSHESIEKQKYASIPSFVQKEEHLQQALVPSFLFINKDKRSITLTFQNKSLEYSLNKWEWEEFYSYFLNGVEGRVHSK